MTLTGEAGVGVRASDGKLMWRHPAVANGTANVATPVFHDNKVFYSSAYGTGAALLGLTAQAGEVKAQQIYFTREMQNHHGGVVLVNGYLYGFHNSILTCLEFATGKTMWRDRSVGKGTVVYADGHLYLQGEDNVVGLAEATPGRLHGEGAVPDRRPGSPELGASGRQRRAPVRPRSGHAERRTTSRLVDTHDDVTLNRRERRARGDFDLRSYVRLQPDRDPDVSRPAAAGP